MLPRTQSLEGAVPAWGVVGILGGHQEGVAVQPADEVVSEAELYHPSFVYVKCLGVVADAETTHSHSIGHAAG